jgi:hypothetical protein
VDADVAVGAGVCVAGAAVSVAVTAVVAAAVEDADAGCVAGGAGCAPPQALMTAITPNDKYAFTLDPLFITI